MNALPTDYMSSFFNRLDRLNRRRQPRRNSSQTAKLNPLYTY